MSKFFEGFEKRAAQRSEMLGTAVNPLNWVAGVPAALVGTAMGPYSEKERRAVNKKDFSNMLIPGVAPYRMTRRMTGIGLSADERPRH
jgi:hypothetical protein